GRDPRRNPRPRAPDRGGRDRSGSRRTLRAREEEGHREGGACAWQHGDVTAAEDRTLVESRSEWRRRSAVAEERFGNATIPLRRHDLRGETGARGARSDFSCGAVITRA